MASQDFPYPSDLDSDGDGGYDSDDFEDSSDGGDDDSVNTLVDNMSFMNFASYFTGRRPNMKAQGSRGHRKSNRNAGPDMCIVSRTLAPVFTVASHAKVQVCGQRPPYVDPRTGMSPYPTCGLTCAGVLKRDRGGDSSRHGSWYPDGRPSHNLPCVVRGTSRATVTPTSLTTAHRCARRIPRIGLDM
jgi:hypothetical protein